MLSMFRAVESVQQSSAKTDPHTIVQYFCIMKRSKLLIMDNRETFQVVSRGDEVHRRTSLPGAWHYWGIALNPTEDSVCAS